MSLRICGLSKSYQGIPVFQNVNLELEDGGVYCLTAPSGAGKTTLLRILMGLETADSGTVIYAPEGAFAEKTPVSRRISAVFQEDRLCPGLSAAKNIRLVQPAGSEEELRRELLKLLPEESLEKPVSRYSGGMRRRVSLIRAMMADGRLLLFDEPFNGLDEETKEAAIAYVRDRRDGRLLLFTTHLPEEAQALNARRILWREEEKNWRLEAEKQG